MKVTDNDVRAIRNAVELYDTPERRLAYAAGDFPRAELVKDLDKRYRWDLFWLSGAARLVPAAYNDSHLDTALRSIVAPL